MKIIEYDMNMNVHMKIIDNDYPNYVYREIALYCVGMDYSMWPK